MRVVSVIILVALASTSALGQFTAGNLVIVRVGDGRAGLSDTATAAFLDEYTAAGTFVQSISLPTSGRDKITLQGTARCEGGISRSTDGRYLVFAGYDATPGTATPASSTAPYVNRVVARIDALGSLDLSTKLTDAFNGCYVRSAASTDGTDLWVAGCSGSGQGASAATRYTTLGSTTSTRLHSSQIDIRWVKIFNGQLYVTPLPGSILGVATVGTGTPMTAGQTVTELPGMPTSGMHSPYGFSISPDGNTMYVADDGAAERGGGIQKWTFSGETWSLAYTLLNNGVKTTSARGLTVDWSGTDPTIYATTATPSVNCLIEIVDTGSGSSSVILATAATNTVFRGVTFAPYSSITFIDGSTFSAPAGTPNTNDNPIGRFQLAGNVRGGSLDAVTVDLSGSYSGITTLKLYVSASPTFTVGGSTLLASTTAAPTATFAIRGGHAVPTTKEYYYVTADLGSSKGKVSVTIADKTQLSFTNAAIYSSFASANLSNPPDVALPVTVKGLNANANASKVSLVFTTAAEINVVGFTILRATAKAGPFKIVSSYLSNGALKAVGSTTTGGSYEFVDHGVSAGQTYYYMIQAVDRSGVSSQVGNVMEVHVVAPKSSAIYQNYPNPFNLTTVIGYDIAKQSQVTLIVYDVLGRQVATIVNEKQTPGTYSVQFDGSKLASGVHFYRLQAGNFTQMRKMMLVK